MTNPDGWPALSPETSLTFESERALPGGSVEIVRALRQGAAVRGRRPTN